MPVRSTNSKNGGLAPNSGFGACTLTEPLADPGPVAPLVTPMPVVNLCVKTLSPLVRLFVTLTTPT